MKSVEIRALFKCVQPNFTAETWDIDTFGGLVGLHTRREWAGHLYWLTGRGGRPVITAFGKGSGLEMLRFS